jgi:hypothetical protein
MDTPDARVDDSRNKVTANNSCHIKGLMYQLTGGAVVAGEVANGGAVGTGLLGAALEDHVQPSAGRLPERPA